MRGVGEKLPRDEIDRDFRSLTLSLSTPLPPLVKPQDGVPVDQWIIHPVFDVSDSGDREPTVAGRRKPRYSGAMFPKKVKPQA
jgi:hypothetical protein